MATLKNVVSTVLVLGTACCATTQESGPRVAGAESFAQSDVGPIAYMQQPVPTQNRACGNLSEAERTLPLQATTVVSVEELREPWPPKGRRAVLQGATIYILATPGLTREWLGHLLECHVARPESGADPFAISHATMSVSGTGDGFAIDVRSTDGDNARQILSTAKSLRN